MARNIEIKARLAGLEALEALEARVAALASEGPSVFVQADTFFHCAAGRLKLREFSPSAGELIFYQRADQSGPKESRYSRVPTTEPAALREALSLAYGVAGRLFKQRTLYRIGRTRVHLDRVEQLGDFLELEVVLGETESPAQGIAEARSLMRKLGIETAALVPSAYLDLLPGREARGP